jgi:hypothetical protein
MVSDGECVCENHDVGGFLAKDKEAVVVLRGRDFLLLQDRK